MKAIYMLLIAGVLVQGLACSSGRGDLMGVDDGTKLSGQNLANAAVDRATALDFYLRMIYQLHPSFKKALATSGSISGQTRTVNILGDYNGRALATSSLSDTLASQLPSLSVKYHDFSNNGRLFFAGTIQYTSKWLNIGHATRLETWILDGTLNFAGDFAGSVDFDGLSVGLDSTGNPVDLIERAENPQYELPLDGEVVILSGANRVVLSPNRVDWPDIPAR